MYKNSPSPSTGNTKLEISKLQSVQNNVSSKVIQELGGLYNNGKIRVVT